jgi:hypothetical protein
MERSPNIGPLSPLPLSWYFAAAAIVVGIHTLHGGRLRTENNPDCGATIQFTLPVENATA